jgi:hypothetical protein
MWFEPHLAADRIDVMAKRHIFFAALTLEGAWIGPAFPADTSPVCMNSGREYKIGEFACIPACHGQRRLARCDAPSGQSSSATQPLAATWTFVSDVCPSAMLPPSPSDATARPVKAAMTPIPLPIERTMSEMSPDAWMRLATLMKANAQ